MAEAAVAARRSTRHGLVGVAELLALHGQGAGTRGRSTRRAVAVTGSGAVLGALVAAAVALSGPAAGPTPAPVADGDSKPTSAGTVTITDIAQPSALPPSVATPPVGAVPADSPAQRTPQPPAIPTRLADTAPPTEPGPYPAPAPPQAAAEPVRDATPAAAPGGAPQAHPAAQLLNPVVGLLAR